MARTQRRLADPTPLPAATSGLVPYLRLLTDSLDAGVLILDARRQIVHCSETMGAMFGTSAAQISAQGFEGFIATLRAATPSLPANVGAAAEAGEEPRTICQEFEIGEPRSVIRWLSRTFFEPEHTEVIICTDVTTEVDLALAYQRLAVTDALTGLANRRGIDQHMRREVARVNRHGYRLSFVLLDVDHFKNVNDRFGHGAGDEVLRRVADAIGRTLRASDMAARWGGEEFLVVLTDTGLEGAHMCAERIRTAVEMLNLSRIGTVTISGGAAELAPGEDLSITLLRADEMLYKAKAAGRNTVCWK